MKVRIIKKQSIEDYIKDNAQSRSGFIIWLSVIKYADWNIPQDILCTFNSADILGKGSDRVVFDIGGNKYRLICSYYFGRSMIHMFIKWIGTHAEYDTLCKNGEQYSVERY